MFARLVLLRVLFIIIRYVIKIYATLNKLIKHLLCYNQSVGGSGAD